MNFTDYCSRISRGVLHFAEYGYISSMMNMEGHGHRIISVWENIEDGRLEPMAFVTKHLKTAQKNRKKLLRNSDKCDKISFVKND